MLTALRPKGRDLLHEYQRTVTTLTVIRHVIAHFLRLSRTVNMHSLHSEACKGKQGNTHRQAGMWTQAYVQKQGGGKVK